MTQVALSLGSNIERDTHIRFALEALHELFGELEISPVYETRAVGFAGPDFYNLVVVANTSLQLDGVLDALRHIEKNAGRDRQDKRIQSRNLDIDILLFGDANLRGQGRNVPRLEIEHATYVLKPLADVLPDMLHPVLGLCFADLWRDFEPKEPTPKRIEFASGPEHAS